ncbi:MAG: ABC transporter permease [Chloroflexales bacterium]|nr:ABC transporter permease [Chloroflexales bacterium]
MTQNRQAQSRGRRVQWFLRDPGALIGACIVIVIVAAALFAPLIAPYDPTRQHLADAFGAPSLRYPLGADHLGRDILSRLLYGARATLGAASLVLAAMLLIAISVGVAAGYYGGWLDTLLMRVVDVFLAFPGLLLAVAVAGTLGSGLLYVTLAMASVWWAGYARIVRSMVLANRSKEYIMAARVLGLRTLRIIVHHILRNIAGPLLVLASLDFGLIILSIAGLNFLGLGVQPPLPEWGTMLNDAQPFLQTDPQLVMYPAAAIFITVLGCNLLGDGLRDWLDPQTRQR